MNWVICSYEATKFCESLDWEWRKGKFILPGEELSKGHGI